MKAKNNISKIKLRLQQLISSHIDNKIDKLRHLSKGRMVYIEYYSHENCECYKIDNPYTEYNKDTIVLCHISDGLLSALNIAIKALKNKRKIAS